jgi:hypothetical protein
VNKRVRWDTGAVLVGVGELLFPAPRRDFAGASVRAGSPSPASPSIIPDGAISPVRLEAKTFPVEPSRVHTRFKRPRARTAGIVGVSCASSLLAPMVLGKVHSRNTSRLIRRQRRLE